MPVEDTLIPNNLRDIVAAALELSGGDRAEYIDHLVASIEDDRQWLAAKQRPADSHAAKLVLHHLREKEAILINLAKQQ